MNNYSLTDFFKIATMGGHYLGLLEDGLVYRWGQNFEGQLGNGVKNPRIVDSAQTRSGDEQDYYGVLDFPKRIVSVATGSLHSLICTKEGEVYSFGGNQYGQLGDGTENIHCSPTLVSLPERAMKVIAGTRDSFALTQEGTLYLWGQNPLLMTAVKSATFPFVLDFPFPVRDIVSNSQQTFLQTQDGDIYAWGWNYSGELGNGSILHRLTPEKCAIRDVEKIVCGRSAVLAKTRNGEIFTWGDNSSGELGQGADIQFSSVPERIFDGVKDIAAGKHTFYVQTEDLCIYGWGDSLHGELGTAHSSVYTTPTPVSLKSTILKDLPFKIQGWCPGYTTLEKELRKSWQREMEL